MYVAKLPCETWMTETPTKFTVFQKNNESEHSAVKYFDKCFSSQQMDSFRVVEFFAFMASNRL